MICYCVYLHMCIFSCILYAFVSASVSACIFQQTSAPSYCLPAPVLCLWQFCMMVCSMINYNCLLSRNKCGSNPLFRLSMTTVVETKGHKCQTHWQISQTQVHRKSNEILHNDIKFQVEAMLCFEQIGSNI